MLNKALRRETETAISARGYKDLTKAVGITEKGEPNNNAEVKSIELGTFMHVGI